MMQPDDNPPVGILLCTAVGEETMEYVNTFIDPKLFVSKYQLQLPEKSQVTAFLKRENKVKSAGMLEGQTPLVVRQDKLGRTY